MNRLAVPLLRASLEAIAMIALAAATFYVYSLYDDVKPPILSPPVATVPFVDVIDSSYNVIKDNTFYGLTSGVFVIAIEKPRGISLKPEYRKILKETGYLDYVLSNIEAIQFVDYQAVWSNGEDAVGLSDIKDGKRWALVATKGRSNDFICATLVHEATHLKGYREIGYMAGQPDAYAAQHEFERKYAKLHPVGDIYPLIAPIGIGLRVTCADGTVTEGSYPQN